ncbi:odorant receptor 131-2-like [Mixophyes fleayi]|uniref:odorant receptor 131-2-like n=1 Tax=Mixophyes fleayi TaxID=3061075 RepID=UPI003F4E1969
MANSTALNNSTTQEPIYNSKIHEILRMSLMAFMLFCFFIFFYLFVVILHVFFTNPHVREIARYVLFVHMLINDVIYLVVSFLLILFIMFSKHLPVLLCYIFYFIAIVCFRITPYNLALMCLERYVAIFFPLSHAELCTVQRSNAAIAVIWIIGIIPEVVELIVLNLLVEKNFFFLNVVCNRQSLTVSPAQNTMRSFTLIISFTVVAGIILFTYIKVMTAARQLGSSKSSALRAGKTVMLHAFQLLLCMTSFTSLFTETYVRDDLKIFPIINYCVYMFIPRFVSPLIYGMRDKVFRKYIRICSCKRINSKVNVKKK